MVPATRAEEVSVPGERACVTCRGGCSLGPRPKPTPASITRGDTGSDPCWGWSGAKTRVDVDENFSNGACNLLNHEQTTKPSYLASCTPPSPTLPVWPLMLQVLFSAATSQICTRPKCVPTARYCPWTDQRNNVTSVFIWGMRDSRFMVTD